VIADRCVDRETEIPKEQTGEIVGGNQKEKPAWP
jgi:hypothetical protein